MSNLAAEAQQVAQSPCKGAVAGSIPAGGLFEVTV
jgi:hypothetical protein